MYKINGGRGGKCQFLDPRSGEVAGKKVKITTYLVMKIEVDCRTFLLLERNFNNFSIIVIFYTEIWRKKLFL